MKRYPLGSFAKEKPILYSLVFIVLYILSAVFIHNLVLSTIVSISLCLVYLYLGNLFYSSGIKSDRMEKGLLFGSPFLINGVGAFVLSIFSTNFSYLEITTLTRILNFTLVVVLIALSEELCFRSIILNSFMKKYGKTYKGTWKALLISSAFFALFHFVNYPHLPTPTLIGQIISSFTAGMCFGAIFIRTRNVWSLLIIHTLINWLGLFISHNFVTEDGITTAISVLNMNLTYGGALLIALLASIVPVVLTFILMQKKYLDFNHEIPEDDILENEK